MSILRGFLDALEGVGFMADISNWLKLRFMSRVMGGNKSPAPASTANSNQPLQAGNDGKGVFDEYLVLAALFDGVDMSQKVTNNVIGVFAGIMEILRKRGHSGAAQKLMSIIGIKESEITSRETEDADDTAQSSPLAARRRGKKTKETTIRRNDRGTRVLLGFYSLGNTYENRVHNSVRLLDTLGILENPADKLAATKKGLHEKWDRIMEAVRKYFGENAVETANTVARHILGSDEVFGKIMADAALASIWQQYNATNNPEEKLQLGEEYSQMLQSLVTAHFDGSQKTVEVDPSQQPQLRVSGPIRIPRKKNLGVRFDRIAWAVVLLTIATILFNK